MTLPLNSDTCTVAVNKNVMFQICTTVVLQCERASKKGVLGATVDPFRFYGSVPYLKSSQVLYHYAETMVFSTYTKQRILYFYSTGLKGSSNHQASSGGMQSRWCSWLLGEV